jgi:hypothetical protein
MQRVEVERKKEITASASAAAATQVFFGAIVWVLTDTFSSSLLLRILFGF